MNASRLRTSPLAVVSRPRRHLAALYGLALVLGCTARTPLRSPAGGSPEPESSVDTGGETGGATGLAGAGGANTAGATGTSATGGTGASAAASSGPGGASGGTSSGTLGSGGATSTAGSLSSGSRTSSAGGVTSNSSGGRTAAGGTTSTVGGATTIRGGSSAGGTRATGGSSYHDGGLATDGPAPPGTPTITDSGYVTVSAGTTVLAGFVSSSEGGSGSSISLTYGPTSFCASGTVGQNSTYNCWATAGFNVNQASSGASGSASSLVLSGSTISVSYVNSGGSSLELQLYDGSDYWCYYLPPSTSPTTKTIPFSSLNTQCWNNGGSAFVSGTPITVVQLVVPGSNTSPTPFDFCFLGMTVQ
jgi:hypothetical protein